MFNRLKLYNQKVAECIYRHKIILLLTFIYALAIIYLSAFHEVWRDEVRALSFVMESKSIIQLFQNLHNEGHPGLWHLILYIGLRLIRATAVLKIASILIAISAVYVFLAESPFCWFQKLLFVFGYFPIYEYSVINRNYGISMLLLFLFCYLYKERFKNIVLVGLILFLLANTNAHSLIIVMAVFLSMLMELAYSKAKIIEGNDVRNRIILGFALIAVGISCSIIQVYPDKTTIVTGIHYVSFPAVIKAGINALLYPGRFFHSAFGFNNVIFVTSIIWLSYVYLLLRKPFLFSIFFTSVIGLGMFFQLVYGAGMRHQGFLYLLIVSALWIDSSGENRIALKPFDRITGVISRHKNMVFYLLLIMQIYMAYHAIRGDLCTQYSSSRDFGEFLKKHLELKDAILIGEPDYAIESVAYYARNPIYIPRERRFGKAVKFTTANRQEFSLEELLKTAQKFKYEFKEPILITIGHSLTFKGPFEIRFSYNKIFTYSEEQLKIFLRQTKKIASFHNAIGDENYDVFLLE